MRPWFAKINFFKYLNFFLSNEEGHIFTKMSFDLLDEDGPYTPLSDLSSSSVSEEYIEGSIFKDIRIKTEQQQPLCDGDDSKVMEFVMNRRFKDLDVMDVEMQLLISQRLIHQGIQPDWYMCMAWVFKECSLMSKAETHVMSNLIRYRSQLKTLDDIDRFTREIILLCFDQDMKQHVVTICRKLSDTCLSQGVQAAISSSFN